MIARINCILQGGKSNDLNGGADSTTVVKWSSIKMAMQTSGLLRSGVQCKTRLTMATFHKRNDVEMKKVKRDVKNVDV